MIDSRRGDADDGGARETPLGTERDQVCVCVCVLCCFRVQFIPCIYYWNFSSVISFAFLRFSGQIIHCHFERFAQRASHRSLCLSLSLSIYLSLSYSLLIVLVALAARTIIAVTARTCVWTSWRASAPRCDANAMSSHAAMQRLNRCVCVCVCVS